MFEASRIDEGAEKQIESYAREHVGAWYSPWEAVKTPFKKRGHGHSTSEKEFCSRFVSEAYEKAKISLVNNPSFCAPGDFLKTGDLQDMGSCTRLATEEDLNALSSTDFPLISQNRARDWMGNVRDLASQDGVEINTINSVYEYSLSHNERDEEVEILLLQSKYLDTWKEDAAVHEYRYSPMGFVSLLNKNYKVAVWEVEALFDCAGHYGDELLQLDIIKGSFRTMGRMANLYRDMIKDINQRLSVLITLSIGKPGVGPLARLSTLCSHLIAGTYEQSQLQRVSDEVEQMKLEWVGVASEWRRSVIKLCAPLVCPGI